MLKHSEFIGKQVTNNVAEYEALIKALELVLRYTKDEVTCVVDSELIYKQLMGKYRVKHPKMLELFLVVQRMQDKFRKVIMEIEKSGKDYAEKKALSWQSQELKYAVMSQEMASLPFDMGAGAKEIASKSSEGYKQYVKETAEMIRQENIAKAIYEKWRSSFEALRSLSSLEKATRNIIGE